MAVLSERDVKKMFEQKEIMEKTDFYVDKHTIVTPSARSYLYDKNISLRVKDDREEAVNMDRSERSDGVVYDTLFGAKLTEKPEFMTHLRGNLLVFKDHPRIHFRGAMDSLESEIIVVQIFAHEKNKNTMVEDLEEIITFIRKLIRCEVSGEEVGAFQLQGLSAADLREHSHHPSKYYGMAHFLPNYKQGEMVARLNQLRTKTREAELVAYQAFKDEYGQVSRVDIIQSLNRLSSLFWIMMFKYLTNKYN